MDSNTFLDYYLILSSLQSNLDYSILEKVFGTDMAEHLISKWIRCDNNILTFLSMLDTFNQHLLLDYALNK